MPGAASSMAERLKRQHVSFSGFQSTPANCTINHESIDKKSWAFLLPTVSEEDAKKHFPDHHSCKVGPALGTSHL